MKKYKDGKIKEKDLEKLILHLRYRVRQDYKAQQLLTFLKIPKICSIYNFKQEQYQSPDKEPYFCAICRASPFDKPPKMKPSCRVYTKPIQFVALSALVAKVNFNWFESKLLEFKSLGTKTT